jgi:hypothetical protein
VEDVEEEEEGEKAGDERQVDDSSEQGVIMISSGETRWLGSHALGVWPSRRYESWRAESGVWGDHP